MNAVSRDLVRVTRDPVPVEVRDRESVSFALRGRRMTTVRSCLHFAEHANASIGGRAEAQPTVILRGRYRTAKRSRSIECIREKISVFVFASPDPLSRN